MNVSDAQLIAAGGVVSPAAAGIVTDDATPTGTTLVTVLPLVVVVGAAGADELDELEELDDELLFDAADTSDDQTGSVVLPASFDAVMSTTTTLPMSEEAAVYVAVFAPTMSVQSLL